MGHELERVETYKYIGPMKKGMINHIIVLSYKNKGLKMKILSENTYKLLNEKIVVK